jgi:hypothetical protein
LIANQVPLSLLLSAPEGKWACKADEDDDMKAAVMARRVGSKGKRMSEAGLGGGFFTSSAGKKKVGVFSGKSLEEGPAGMSLEVGGGGIGSLPERQQTTAARRFGISSFVYTRRRPFHPHVTALQILHTTHYTLHTTHYTLHTTHYTLHTTHYTLHTTHYTLHKT